MVNPEDLASLIGNPEALLDGLALPAETAATRAINAATATLRAVFDAVGFSVADQIFGTTGGLSEAYRRHRMADARGEDAAAALFGISLQGDHQHQADQFVATITAEHQLNSFTALLRADGLPTVDELTSPETWYLRVTNSPLA
jgi:uncharacterized protein (DUF2342 family)